MQLSKKLETFSEFFFFHFVNLDSINFGYYSERPFSDWIVFTGINKYGKDHVVQISTVIRPIYHVKGPLKRDFLDIYLTTLIRVRQFKNTSAMRLIFFLKMFKIESKFRKFQKKIEKMFFVSQIIACENGAIHFLYEEENTCYR